MNLEERGAETHESKEEMKARVGNSIQLDLMSSMCNPDDGEKGIDEWLDKHLQDFKMLFDKVVEDDSSYLDRWDKNVSGEREGSLDFFVNELRKLHNSR